MATIMMILTVIGFMILFMPETSRALCKATAMIVRALVRYLLSRARGLKNGGYG